MNQTSAPPPPPKIKDRSVSWIRFLAMLSIITCHFMQYFDCELAWWFNVGVQIFLCISGYLYGNKEIETLPFFQKAFPKILISYYIVFIPFAILLLAVNAVPLYEVLSGFVLGSVIPGGEHLWFIPTILCCYVITPFLSVWFRNTNRLLWKFLWLLLLTFWVFSIFIPFFNPAWISCYITGYFLAKYTRSAHYKRFVGLLLVLTVGCNTLQIAAEYIFDWSVPYETIVYNYAHALLGVSLFVILRFLFKNAADNPILTFSDAYSYEIYLVHQFFILGPLTLMELTPSMPLNMFLVIILTVLGGVLAKTVSIAVHKGVRHLSANRY